MARHVGGNRHMSLQGLSTEEIDTDINPGSG
jgi:hypothetical protein